MRQREGRNEDGKGIGRRERNWKGEENEREWEDMEGERRGRA